jgi:hypothetical protein
VTQSELAAAFRKLEALQAAAAEAGPAIDALLEATRASGELRPYHALGINQHIAGWCRSLAINPAAPLQAGPDGEELGDLLLAWARR